MTRESHGSTPQGARHRYFIGGRRALLALGFAVVVLSAASLSGPVPGGPSVSVLDVASSKAARSSAIRAPRQFDPAGRVGSVWLGASKNAAIRAWGVPSDIRRTGPYTELVYGSRLLVRTDARRIIAFEVFGSQLRARRGVTVGSTEARWRRAYRGIRRAEDGTLLYDRRGNLTAVHVRGGQANRVSMLWRGGASRSGRGAGNVGRGAGSNPFAGDGRDGKVPCASDGKSGWCWCTWWAYEKRSDVYKNSAGKNGVPIAGWDAKMWLQYASKGGGYPTGTEPIVGALAVFPNSSRWGHIAYVESVNADGSFVISEYNHHMNGRRSLDRRIERWQISAQGVAFIYGGPATGAEYIGHIVHWAGDTKQQKTSWLVVNRNGKPRRNWIPSSAIYNCLKTAGAPGPHVLPSEFLSTWLVDIVGQHATCAGAGASEPAPSPQPADPPPSSGDPPPSGGSTPPPTSGQPPPTSQPTPPPAPRTWSEQQGSYGANTFTNPYNASGMGQKIQPGQWVEVSCKVYAPQIQSANPDGYWYRIASPPWNNHYYAVANTFWNGDVPGQKPYTRNTDWAVPNC